MLLAILAIALFGLVQTERLLRKVKKMSEELQAELDALASDVESLTSVDQSAISLLNGLSAQLSAALAAAANSGASEAQLAQLTSLDTALKNRTTELANAVTSNTPAAQPPEPEPAPAPEASASAKATKSSS